MMLVTLLAISLLAAENITANRSRFITRLLAVVKLLVFNTHTHTQYTHVHERTVYMPIGTRRRPTGSHDGDAVTRYSPKHLCPLASPPEIAIADICPLCIGLGLGCCTVSVSSCC